MRTVGNFIAGRTQPALEGGSLENLNPATGECIARIPDSGPADVDQAVAAAREAFPDWSARPVADRMERLERLAGLIQANAEELAALESEDTGKPRRLAREIDMQRAEANLRFFARAMSQWSSAGHDMGPTGFNYTRREPLGPVALITPWNLPLYLLTWKLGPALVTGNTVVAKPSELTPLTADALARLANEAGLPAGVFNLVHGLGARCGQALVDHPDIKAVSFTGGTVTGRRIAQSTAPRLIKLSLELGGKNPALVFDDADLDRTVAGLLRAGFTNQGQVCLCSSRFLIHESIYEPLVERLVEAVKGLKVGDPEDEDNTQGALISAAHRDKVLGYIDQARQDGGRILCGGEATRPTGRCQDGAFVLPTLIADLPPESRLHREEIFGPVVTLQRFSSEEEAIALANDVDYGLAATVWTEGLSRAHRVAGRLQSGIVWVNNWLVRDLRTPFGGVKASGLGREGGHWSLEFFTEPKNVFINGD
ncbi:aldehyde dehydrogenase [Wenzhouxiangella marina]|uniref:2-hydroxymuconic semialdehyde dehydrogenase n=1 Tax=Wenzhouxiangella marina TaxID=1579979 RepID=A0A0K0XVY7_9GAMM|nr:aldehyde dehydrogenase [Wenzhouxiangella marina]AKS41835.1 2-hydroxymuconic semialdehyde dehydrogenase [Wenzhouxiangella marina]MBB6086400.1 aminomuconate-semialdehyde/2-hydroxymuconate-6-semialdehyde dehydrogenase [Wenzhouxiangella marina]